MQLTKKRDPVFAGLDRATAEEGRPAALAHAAHAASASAPRAGKANSPPCQQAASGQQPAQSLDSLRQQGTLPSDYLAETLLSPQQKRRIKYLLQSARAELLRDEISEAIRKAARQRAEALAACSSPRQRRSHEL